MSRRETLLCWSVAFLTFVAALACAAVPALACTAVYVGKDVSGDGTTILARSNDYQQLWANRLEVVERVENQPGRTMPIDRAGTVRVELPATTYHYTATPWMDSAIKASEFGRDATACTNEYGLAMTMSVTGHTNDAALSADGLVKDGLTEFTASDFVVCQCQTARDAVKLLAHIIDEYGSSECNMALIADQREAWYMEMYTGHQYAAVKLPTNKVAAFGNEFTLEYLADYEDSITSGDLESLADDAGFAVRGRKGELNLFKTYSGQQVISPYNHMRTWVGHRVLSASDDYANFNNDDFYPLCFEPKGKVTVRDVMELMRNRFEGTEYCPDEDGRTDMRVIGTEIAMSVHVQQIYHDLPAGMACVTWECVGPAVYGVFVPLSNACVAPGESYNRNQPADKTMSFDTDTYPYYAFKELNTLCSEFEDSRTYGEPVRKHWSKAEDAMVPTMRTVLGRAAKMKDAAASAYVNAYCNAVQERAFADAKELLNQVRWYSSLNSTSFKNLRDSQTGFTTEERRYPDPIKVKLDASVYAQVPDAQHLAETGTSTNAATGGAFDGHMALVTAFLACVVVLLACIVAAVRRLRQ